MVKVSSAALEELWNNFSLWMSSKRNTFSLRMSRYPEKDLFFQYIWLIPLWCITNLKISPKMIDFTHNLLLNQEITRSHWRLWHLHSKSTNRIREIKINKPCDQRVMWLKGHWSGSSLYVTTLPGGEGRGGGVWVFEIFGKKEGGGGGVQIFQNYREGLVK